MNRGRIIVIEGADASGKTSLGDRIHRVLGSAHRIHLRVHKRLPTWQYAAIRRAARFSCKGEHTILDRPLAKLKRNITTYSCLGRGSNIHF